MDAVPEHFDHPADAAEFRRPAHDAFGLGAIEAGVERYRYAGGEHVAAAVRGCTVAPPCG